MHCVAAVPRNASSFDLGEHPLPLDMNTQEFVATDEFCDGDADRSVAPLSPADYAPLSPADYALAYRLQAKVPSRHGTLVHAVMLPPSVMGEPHHFASEENSQTNAETTYLPLLIRPDEGIVMNDDKLGFDERRNDCGSLQAVIGSEYASRRGGGGDQSTDQSLFSAACCRHSSVDSFPIAEASSCPLELRLCTFNEPSLSANSFPGAKRSGR